MTDAKINTQTWRLCEFKKKINKIDKQPFWSHILLKSNVIGLLFTKPNTYGVHKELTFRPSYLLKFNNNTPYVHTKY